MRWLAVFLPAFALDIHGRAIAADGPLAVAERLHGRQVLMACNPVAGQQGVRPGMSDDAAFALVPELRIVARDEEAEAAALANLAAWAGQFSDVVSIESGQGLMLESGRSLSLFGGGRRLGRLVRNGLAALGYRARVALAPTARGSWWLAVGGGGACIAAQAELRRRLLALPLDVMALSPRVAADLRNLGLSTLGDVAVLPRDGLARRAGASVIRQLDEALGRRAEARAPHRRPPRFHGHLDLPSPVLEREALLFPLRRLLLELEGMLRGMGAGVPGFRVTLSHYGSGTSGLDIGMAMTDDDGGRFLELLRHRLERLELAAPVERVAVDAAEIRTLAPVTGDLFGAAGERDARREAALLNRLAARLGDGAVCRLAVVADHRPERAWRVLPVAVDGGDDGDVRAAPPRPRWLLAEPQPLAAFGGSRARPEDLRFIQGPERIEAGWWDGQDLSRDYYVAETRTGRRLWIFRDRRPPHRWFVHGLFA